MSANGVSIMFVEDELQKVMFNIVVTLINSCNKEQLEMIQRELSKNVLAYLREIWKKVYPHKNSEDSTDGKIQGRGYMSSMKPCNLAETIFRLSMNVGEYLTYPLELVSQGLFGVSDCSFQNFILRHWEDSTFVLRSSQCLSDKENIFGPFVRLFNCEEAISSFLSDSLPRMVSCLPFSSDDLNPLDFLVEVKEKIGCPLMYQQDVRIVKTNDLIEMHFLPKDSLDCVESPYVLDFNDILKCEEGYKQGYSIALRGLEFRFEPIAAIADAMACMFGQPSVGANLYLTPSNSQGLARHYDDHCVFVCQLVGEKQWTITEEPTVKLPRLYEPLKSVCRSQVESVSEEKKCVLNVGDVLYIPRGSAHEACTITRNDEPDAQNSFSIHLTFGIEVEPPFEWEGFAHVALHSWSNKKDAAVDSMSVYLLHFAIRHISYSNPDFRKACLVGANLTPSESNDWLKISQRTFFTRIVDIISTKSSHLDAIREFEAAVCSHKDPFRWLDHLNQNNSSGYGQSLTVTGLSDLCHKYQDRQEEVDVAFMQTKLHFCENIVFAEVAEKYKMLLDKYRKARKQYIKGMLSLHCFNN